jgi:hypothetical protein
MISAKSVSSRLILALILIGLVMILTVQVAQTQENDFTVTNLTPTSSFHVSKANESPESEQPINQPNVTSPGSETAVALDTTCQPSTLPLGTTALCTITVQNVTATPLDITIMNVVPQKLTLLPGSVTGAQVYKNRVLIQTLPLAGGEPGQFLVTPGSSPAGYVSLAALGLPPLTDIGDESLINFTTPPYIYQGQTYTDLALFSNGYIMAGIGSEADISHLPQQFPDPTPPNNVIAPFWTDLNPEIGGQIYASVLSTDEATWIVLEWENVPDFDTTGVYTFQLWIAANSDTQDISMVYAQVEGNGASTGLSVGAEDAAGLEGDTYETVPQPGEALEVTVSDPTPGQSHTITYQMKAQWSGSWSNCAVAKVLPLRQVYVDCFAGTNTD